MRIKNFKSFNESVEPIILPNPISISDFVDKLNETSRIPLDKDIIVNWWENNLPMIKIHYFPFKNNQIMGCYFTENRIAVNSSSFSSSDMRLFISIHESRHILQDVDGTMEEKYFKTVVNGNKEEFLINYRILEDDANTFAINACKEMGINSIVSIESKLRSNELMGEPVYNMMSQDIKLIKPNTFSELLYSQII